MASVGEAVTDPAHDEPVAIPDDDAVRRVDFVVWGLALVVAIAVRVALVRSPNGTIHGDEAVVGLMAHNVLDGEPRVFYWGQDYGGSLEAFVAAVAFVPFGTSVAALKISTLVLDAVSSLFVFLVGRRLVGVRAAGYATAMFLIGPVGITALSLSSRGFYWSTLICGLVMVLFALRGLDRPARRLDWFVSGIAAGVGFWQSPQILYFAIPVIIFVAVRLGRSVLSAWPAVAGAGLGALPWIEVNLRDGFPSLDSPPQAVATTYFERLRVFGDEGVPVALGLQLGQDWVVPVLAPLALVALVVLVAVAFIRRPPPSWLLIVTLLASPFVFAIFPFSWTVGEGRYMLFAVPFLAMAIAYAARWRALQIAGVAIVALLTVSWVDDLSDMTPISQNVAVPTDMQPLRDALAEAGITRAFADYWIAYRLTFETDEEVIVATSGKGRYQRYDDLVRAEPVPPWIFVDGSVFEPRFEAELNRLGIPFTTTEAGGFTIYQPSERVLPESIAPETFVV
jgi:hypothetical protein